MAATSPYLQNDYQAASTYRPYSLPINDIFKGLVAQDSYWKQGAARVKAVYDNALDLQLTNQENIDIRDNYLKEAQKQLTKLSSMNLADPEVQRKGFELFKPLFRDIGVMSDDQATRHISKVNSDALNFRNKENGKYYSPTNHQYALFGADEFRNSKDRFAGQAYLQNKKEYEPFYDPTSELTQILKNCKPDKASGEAVQGFYINGYSNESLSAMKVSSCLDGGLSDKAKRQLQINGAVTYKRNPEALRDKYIPHLQGTRKGLSEQKAAIEGILANVDNLHKLGAKDLEKLGLQSAAQVTPEFIQTLKERLLATDNRIMNINETVGRLSSGDLSPMLGENFESIAAAIYSQDYMDNVGEGFQYNWQTNTVKADPVQMMFYKERQTNARLEDSQTHDRFMQSQEFEHDTKMKMYDLYGKMLKDGKLKDANMFGGGELDFRAFSAAGDNKIFSALEPAQSYDKVTQELAQLSDTRNNLNSVLNQRLKEEYNMDQSFAPGSDEEKQFVSNLGLGLEKLPDGDPKKKLLKDYFMKMDEVNAKNQVLKNMQDIADAQVAPMEQAVRADIGKMDPLEFNYNGKHIVITGDDVYNALTGKPGRLQVNFGKQSAATGSIPSGKFGAEKPTITIDGVTIPIEAGQGFSAGNSILRAITHQQAKYKEKTDKIAEVKNKIIADELVVQQETYNLPGINDKESEFKKTIADIAGIQENYREKVVIGATDARGNIKVTIGKGKDSESDYDQEDAIKRLIQYNATGKNVRVNSVTNEIDSDGDAVLMTGIEPLNAIQDTGLERSITPLIRTLEKKSRLGKSESSAYMTSGKGGDYKIQVSKAFDGVNHDYTIISKDTQKPIYSTTDRQQAIQFFMITLDRNAPNVKVPKK